MPGSCFIPCTIEWLWYSTDDKGEYYFKDYRPNDEKDVKKLLQSKISVNLYVIVHFAK